MHRLRSRLRKLEAKIDVEPSWTDYFAQAERLARTLLSPADRDLVADAIQLRKERGATPGQRCIDRSGSAGARHSTGLWWNCGFRIPCKWPTNGCDVDGSKFGDDANSSDKNEKSRRSGIRRREGAIFGWFSP
jgi:hypothetical protein